MSTVQNQSDEIKEIDAAVKASIPVVLTPQQQLWIDYNALGGLITDITGTGKTDASGNELSMRKVPITEFAKMINVARDTLRQWRIQIPDFWQRVNDRRNELAPQSRLQIVHENWYIQAAKVKNWQVTEAWLRNFDPNYKEARTKVEMELGGGIGDLLETARKRQLGQAIEGEVVDAKDNTADA